MRSWLSVLPHQIPFRAASAATRISDDTIEGLFLCTSNDPLVHGFAPLQVMLLEAMAQLGGGLAFDEDASHGFLSGIDHWELDRPIEVGEVVTLTVTREASFGAIFRLRGTGSVDGLECARGRFYLAAPPEE